MISKNISQKMFRIQKYNYLNFNTTNMKSNFSFQSLQNKLDCQNNIKSFHSDPNIRIQNKIHSNALFIRNKPFFWFCNNKKQNIKSTFQGDLKTIQNFDLNDVKGFQRLIKAICTKYKEYKDQNIKNIQIFKKIIQFLKQKNCEKNHPHSYCLLFAIYLDRKDILEIQNFLPQVLQIIRFYDQKRINLKLLKLYVFSYYYQVKPTKDQQKALQYLENIYSHNTIDDISRYEVLLIQIKLNRFKLQEAQKLINLAVDILKKSQNFNILAQFIFKFKQKLYKFYELRRFKSFTTKQDSQMYNQFLYSKYLEISRQIVQYMARWRNQLDKQQLQIVNKINQMKKQKGYIYQNPILYPLRWQYVNVMWDAYSSLMEIVSNNHEEVIQIFTLNEFLFQGWKMFNTSSLVRVFLYAFRSFIQLGRREQALKALSTADEILFSITTQKPLPETFIYLFNLYTKIFADKNLQDISKINIDKFKTRLILLSENQHTFNKEFELRKMICNLYLSRQFYQKQFNEIEEMEERFQKFRSKLSKQSQLDILLNIFILKSSAYLRKKQFLKCIEVANKADILIKIYQNPEQFQNLQQKAQYQQPKLQLKFTKFFQYIQAINTNRFRSYINLAEQTKNINQIRQNQIKCLQSLERVFAYKDNKIKDVQGDFLQKQFNKLQKFDMLGKKKWKTQQATERNFQFFENILDQFQYIIQKAIQKKVNQKLIIYHSIKLQNLKINYDLQINIRKDDLRIGRQAMLNAINKWSQIVKRIQNIMENSNQQEKQFWFNVKTFFIQNADNMKPVIQNFDKYLQKNQ